MPRNGGRNRRRRKVMESSDEDDEESSGEMQQQQVQKKDDRSNVAILENTLSILIETQRLGIETLSTLEEQNEQILRIDGYLDEMNSDLKKAQRSIDNINSLASAIVNAFRKEDQKESSCFCGSAVNDSDVDDADRPEAAPMGSGGGGGATSGARRDPEAPVAVPDAPMNVPAAVRIGLELEVSRGDDQPAEKCKELLKRLLKIECTNTECVLSLYSPKGGKLTNAIQNCIVLTSTRLLNIQQGQLTACWFRHDLLTNVQNQGSAVVLTLVDNEEHKINIADGKVRQFFYLSLQRAMKLCQRNVQKEDELLDDINVALDGVLEVANAQNRAIIDQGKMLETTGNKLDNTDKKVVDQTKQMQKITKESGGCALM